MALSFGGPQNGVASRSCSHCDRLKPVLMIPILMFLISCCHYQTVL